MGAGFGGSILALLEQEAQARFEEAMRGVQVLFCGTADGAFAATPSPPAGEGRGGGE